ncbi:MAG: TAXI family TRAP transporter solute-binding subunit [Oscillospiraceae bacterium]|nr:TAXI family TRAP transporter solute-binding subunit [Oscillospiraceae bacterium]
MKKLIALLLACVMVFALVACGAPAEKTGEEAPAAAAANLTVGTGGESGTYYAVAGVLGTVIGNKSDVKWTVVSTGGSKDNLVNMKDNIYQLATVQSDVMTYAYEGTNSFADSGKIDNFKVLGALYAETVQMVTVNPEIDSVDDLKGKSVCIGDVGSGTYYNTIDVLAAYDMTLEDITPVYQSFGDSTESLKDGKIDAAFLCAGAPTTAVTELAASSNVYMISIDDEHMEKLLAACPYYASYTIPAGTYNGYDKDTTTVTVKATLVASDSVSDDVAYSIVKTIFENKEEITGLHAKGAELSLEFATDGIAVPFAKGAAQYYAENGITVATVE